MDRLLEHILEIEKRPGLYIGSTNTNDLGHYLNGYIHAKKESLEHKDFGNWLIDDFRIFLVDKYDDDRNFNWASLVIANEEDGKTTDAFFRLLHEFLAIHRVST